MGINDKTASVIEQVKQAAFNDELKKIAKEDAPEKNTKYIQGYLGSLRAMSMGNKARNIFGNKEWIMAHGKETLKGMGIGAASGIGAGSAIGAGIGALIGAKRGNISKGIKEGLGLGAFVGGIVGLSTGADIGSAIGNKKFLATKGITHKGLFIPRGYNFTEEAKKQYRVKD